MNTTEQQLHHAKALFERGEEEAGRLALLQLLQGEPDNHAALLMLGGAYFSQQKFSEAERVFERLVKLEPGSGKISIALFNTLWKQGRQQEAAEEIRRFIGVADKVAERETLEQYAQISQAIAADGGLEP